VPSTPIYSSIFFRRSIYITRQQSAVIVAGLKMIGAIDRNTGWLNYDPRMVSDSAACACCCGSACDRGPLTSAQNGALWRKRAA
jgi:hypothetical protein